MLSLNLSLHRMLLFESCVSLFYWSKIKTTKAHISTDSLWLNQNCYFFFKAFCFCPPGWILPWLAALCPSPAAGHRAGWGWTKPLLGSQRIFPSSMATRDNENCCSAALGVPGCSWINDSHPQGALAGQTHSWRQNQQQCQWQACITSPPGEWIHNFQESVAGGSTSSQVKA